jgi:hypothetical protein
MSQLKGDKAQDKTAEANWCMKGKFLIKVQEGEGFQKSVFCHKDTKGKSFTKSSFKNESD